MDQQKLGLQSLREMFPWPAERPSVRPQYNGGWLSDGTKQMLSSFLNDQTKLVIELGSWMGLSTRFILEHAPQAEILCIDHWMGSVEHALHKDCVGELPNLYETFLATCWEFKERIVPVRMSTVNGLLWAKMCDVTPDLIFIDAGHDFFDVLGDVTQSLALFPGTRIVGDDFNWRETTRTTLPRTVKLAAEYYANANNLTLVQNHYAWTLEPGQ